MTTVNMTEAFRTEIAQTGVWPLQEGAWDIQLSRTNLGGRWWSPFNRKGRTIWEVIPLDGPLRSAHGLTWPQIPPVRRYLRGGWSWRGVLRRNGVDAAVLFDDMQTWDGTLRVVFQPDYELKVT